MKLGCKGPVVKCNVPVRGWVNGIGGCPNVGGICMACTMPGFPTSTCRSWIPIRGVSAAANFQRFTYGPVFRNMRKRNLEKKFDIEPEWRKRGPR